MRLVWHGNAPWNSSGYGVQTALFVPRIASLGNEILISAPYSFGASVLEWEAFPVFGCARDSAGNDVIIRNHEYFKADLTITLADVFGLARCAPGLPQINVAHWFPVDCNPLAKGDAMVLREGGGHPIAMSGFGHHVLTGEGTEPSYIPLAVDTSVFCPGDPRPYRDTIPGVTDETFVIGLCAMNRDLNRKGFAEQLLAFSRFHAEHPDSFLAVHSTPAAVPGLNLAAMAGSLGITEAVTFPDGYLYDAGIITREQMAAWYRGLDVLSMCSYAEGFGLPLIEAQACGIPVITTDASAMTELCGAGWLVSGTPFWTDGHQAWWKRPDIEDIWQAYEAAFTAREDGTLPKKPARDFAVQFDADRVFEVFWKPVLARLEENLR
jgi:glycosyltransferase involved in cell wall biosynthesis